MPRTAKVVRIGVMAQELLEEARRAPLDEPGQARLRDFLDASIAELSGCLPDRLAAELAHLVPTITGRAPSYTELRIAQAQLTGWLEGLLQSIQTTVDAQQAAALQQLAGLSGGDSEPGRAEPAHPDRADAYL